MPVELARLEAAVLAAVAREAAGVAVDQVAHQLQVAPPLGRAGGDDLRLEQPVEAEQRRVATQLVAHQRVRRLGALLFQRLLEHGVEQIERGIALEIAGEQPQPVLAPPCCAMRLEQPLRRERDIRRVLRLDALPVLDRDVEIIRASIQVSQLEARPHAFAVGLERRLQVPARRVRARLRRLGGRQLAEVLGEVARVGFHLLGHLDGARPVLLLLEDLQQVAARLDRLRAVGEPAEHLLGAIEDAGLEVVLAELRERYYFLLRAQIGALEQVLVHADGAVILAASPEQAAEREVQLDRLRVDLDHLDERLDRLVGLLVEQEIEPLEVGARQRPRLGDDLLDVDARRNPAQAEEQREAEQPPEIELHR